MALLIGKAVQGPMQVALRSNWGQGLLNAQTLAITAASGNVQGVYNQSNFRNRWNARKPTDTGFQRVWISAYSDTTQPMPFYLPIVYDVFFFMGPM